LLAIGGSGILAPFLLIIGYKMKRASVTTALVATIARLAGFLGFVAHAHISAAFLIESIVVIFVGSIIRALLGVKVVKPSWLRMVLGLIISASALKMMGNLIR